MIRDDRLGTKRRVKLTDEIKQIGIGGNSPYKPVQTCHDVRGFLIHGINSEPDLDPTGKSTFEPLKDEIGTRTYGRWADQTKVADLKLNR